MCEKCIINDCTKCKIITLKNIHIPPFETDNKEINKLFSYFLYKAPTVESALSRELPVIFHNEIIGRMFQDRHFKYQNFCSFNSNIEKEFSKSWLSGDELCLKCKRFVCKKKKGSKNSKKETELECLLRHVRNAIAHGRVYYSHAGNKIHIVFEDKNSNGNLSARIICIKADLEHWKKILCDNRYYQD